METINKYKNEVNYILNKKFINELYDEKLKNVCKDSINGGKRLRSMIVLDIVNTLNTLNNTNINADYIAIVSELLHTASLIIDDLPCMDDDKTRRGQPTIHYKYGETCAQITTSILISYCYKYISLNLDELIKKGLLTINKSNKIKLYLFRHLSSQIKESTKGQLLDIYPLKLLREGHKIDNNIEEEILKNIIKKKTTPFFEVAFIGGYLIGCGEFKNIDDIKKLSDYFGLAFQIYDDFDDLEQDSKKTDTEIVQNYVIIAGKEKAYNLFMECINNADNLLTKLNINSILFKEIFSYLIKKVNKNMN